MSGVRTFRHILELFQVFVDDVNANIILIGLIVFIILVFLIIIAYVNLDRKIYKQKYNHCSEIITKSSIVIQKLRELNQQYNFYTIPNKNPSYTIVCYTDDEKRLTQENCEVYLKGYLYKNKDILELIKQIYYNNKTFPIYCEEVDKIRKRTELDNDIIKSNRLNKKIYLNSLSSKIINIKKKRPVCKIYITFELRHSKNQKTLSKSFNINQLNNIVKSLENNSIEKIIFNKTILQEIEKSKQSDF